MDCFWWEKMIALPIRRLCKGLAARVGFRKSGLMMLSREVQACEYEDVQIMWEMLKKTETQETAHPSKLIKLRSFRNVFAWSRYATCFSNKF